MVRKHRVEFTATTTGKAAWAPSIRIDIKNSFGYGYKSGVGGGFGPHRLWHRRGRRRRLPKECLKKKCSLMEAKLQKLRNFISPDL